MLVARPANARKASSAHSPGPGPTCQGVAVCNDRQVGHNHRVASTTVEPIARTTGIHGRPSMVSVGTIVWLASELMFFAGLFAMYFTIRSVAPDTLVSVREFDRYQGKGVPQGRVSLSLRLTFRSPERTLTDAEVDEAMTRIVDALGATHGAVRR